MPDVDLIVVASLKDTPAPRIHVVSAVGTARTALAAFDRALLQAGVANFNLIRLSSVLPPGTEVVDVPRWCPPPEAQWGDRLYAVYATQPATRRGQEAWAGVGWVQDRTSGRGLFVEHEGEDEQAVRDQIVASLEDLQAGRGVDLGPIQSRVVGGRCVDLPISALVLVAYSTEGWPWPASKCGDGHGAQPGT